MLHFLLFCVLSIRVAHAVTIQSTFLNVFEANGTQGNQTQWQQRTMTISCSNTAARNPNLIIGNLSYDIFCQPPQYSFKTTLRQFIPHAVRKFTAEYCEVDSLIDFAHAGPTTGASGAINGRRLLSVPVNAGQRRLMDAETDCLKNAANDPNAYITCAGQYGGNYGCSQSDPVASKLNGCPPWFMDGGGCGTNVKCALQNYLAGQTQVLETTALWITGQQAINEAQTAVVSNLTTAMDLQLQQIRKLDNATEQQSIMLDILAHNSDANYKNVHDIYVNLTSALVSQLQIDASLSQQEQEFENITTNNFRKFGEAGQQLSANISANMFTLTAQDRQNTQLIRGLANIFGKSRRMDGVRRGLASIIWNLINVAKSQGLQPFLDPSAIGSAPGPASTASQTVFVDIQYLNLINASAQLTPIVHQYKIAYYCRTGFVSDEMHSSAEWPDLLEQIGPVGCINLPGSTFTNCDCWLQINHDTCAANTAPNDGLLRDFDWQQLSSTTDITTFILKDNPQYCSGTGGSRTSTGPWDGTLIDDVRVWNTFVGQLCASYPLAPQTAGLHSSGSSPRQQQLVSTRLGSINLVPAANPDMTCQPNYDYIFRQTQSEPNVVFTIFTYWVSAQKLLFSDQFIYDKQIHGVLPNFLTYEEIPFQLLNNNKTYTCHRASFLAVSSDTRPVFQVTPIALNSVVQVNAYDSAPVCDNTGCIFGTPVDTQAVATAAATVPFDNLLPGGSDTIVGEWRTRGIPTMSTVFDVPSGGAPIDNVNAIRRGKLTYTWQPIPDNYNISTQTSYAENLPVPLGPWPPATLMDKWNQLNPVTFNAIDAQFSLDFTETPFANGKCQTPSNNVAEWACDMFDHFSIGALTDMRNKGLLVLIPSEWSYIVTLNIVDGEIIQRVFPGCPEIGYTSFTNGYQQVTLTNSLPNPITAVLRTTNLSPDECPTTGDQRFELLPKQSISSFVLPCGHQLITVYQLDVGGVLKPCSDALNITFNPTSQANVAMFTSSTTNRSIVDDSIQAQLAQFQIQSLGLIDNLVPLLSEQFTPDLTVPQRSDAIDQLIAAQNRTLQALYGAATTIGTQSALEAIKPYQQTVNALNTQVNALEEREAQFLSDTRNGVAVLTDEVATQVVLTNETTTAIGHQLVRIYDYVYALTNAQTSTAACNWCGDSIVGDLPGLCGVICSIITVLIGLLPIVAIAAGVYLIYYCYKKRSATAAAAAITSGRQVIELQQKTVPSLAKTEQATHGKYSASERDKQELAHLLSFSP